MSDAELSSDGSQFEQNERDEQSSKSDEMLELALNFTKQLSEKRNFTEFAEMIRSHYEEARADSGVITDERLLRDCEDFISIIKAKGMEGFYKELLRRLNEWKEVSLNIGIIGSSGVGKSTLINTLRGLRPIDQGGAPTGVVQTTLMPTPYEYRESPNVKIWDLPGVNTVEFPRNEYLEKIKFEQYDFFVIVCCSRFTEDDRWFACKVQSAGKRISFVRTKIDNDVQNNKDDYGEAHDEDQLLSTIRQDCIDHLGAAELPKPQVFLISKNPFIYDFGKFEAQLITDMPEIKRETALLLLRSASKQIIDMKAQQLMRRSIILAIAFAMQHATNSRSLFSEINIYLITTELTLYREVLGLTNDCLNLLSHAASVPKDVLVNEIENDFWKDLNEATVRNLLLKHEDELTGDVTGGKTGFLCREYIVTSNARTSMQSAALTVINKALSIASSNG